MHTKSFSPLPVLYVDLSSKKVWKKEITKEMMKKFLGSRGINASILWDETNAETHPLRPENVLVFGTGTLSGTLAPSSGRTTLTCLSPATGGYLKSSTGGHWGSELRFAGYSTLVIKGRSTKPVYLWINDDKVMIKDASHLWGKDVRQTTDSIKKELKDDHANVACIGPAGENLVIFASVMFNYYNAAARGGIGAVMGSKNLKAVAVKGTIPISVFDSVRYKNYSVELRHKLAKDTGSKNLSMYGTAGIIDTVNATHSLPSYNFQKGYVEDAHKVGGQYLKEAKFLERSFSCDSCSTACHRYTVVDSGPWQGSFSGGPEYETLTALGVGCGITDTATVLRANELCNILGMDTISAGSVIQWAMECVEKGILTKQETDGACIEWGNGEVLVELLEKIAFCKGFGAILAKGVKQASDIVGGDSWKWAVQSKGLEQSRVEVRLKKGYALAFAVNMRGPDHLHTECIAESGRTPEAKALIKRICGSEKYANPYITEKRAEIVRWHEDCYAITDSLGICAFATTLAYAVSPYDMANLFSFATGLHISENEIMEAGKRIVTLEKCINVRKGFDRSADVLPWRMMNEPVNSGPNKGMRCSKEELDQMLNEYYLLHGWDKETSFPTEETLNSLGLERIAKELSKQ